MTRRALVTGAAGQDGSYLVEMLLGKGYEVHGAVLSSAPEAVERLRPVLDRVRLWEADLAAAGEADRLIQSVGPDEVYHLAAQSSVAASWERPWETAAATALGAGGLLEAVRRHRPGARFFQASSSEVFGRPAESPQTERTPFRPINPYGAAKAHAHWLAGAYREKHGLFVCCGILFGHESPRRDPSFLSRKATRAAARVKRGLDRELRVGNLDVTRDWGYAPEYVDAMWRMLQRDAPGDYVVATGASRTVRDFVRTAFACVGLDWEDHVVVDPALVRPADADGAVGDPRKAREELSWRAETGFEELVRLMVEADLAALDMKEPARK